MKLLDEIQDAYEKSTQGEWKQYNWGKKTPEIKHNENLDYIRIETDYEVVGYIFYSSKEDRNKSSSFITKVHNAWPDIYRHLKTIDDVEDSNAKALLKVLDELERTKAALEKCKSQRI